MCDSNFHDAMKNHVKGLPSEIKNTQSYDLRKEEVSLPCATLKKSAVKHNIEWMQDFANHFDVLLAPHGKTSLTTEILKQQVEAGAWGITVASIQQAYVAKRAGAKRIILANQLVGKTNFELAAKLMDEVELYVCVDSVKNIDDLSRFFESHTQPLSVLIEFGVSGGRCGVRNEKEVRQLIDEIAKSEGLTLHGIEFYEGVIHGTNEENEVRQFLSDVSNLFMTLDSESVFDTDNPIITGAGSAWYDVVTETFLLMPSHFRKIIRPGCYVSHDKGIYQVAQSKVLARIAQSEKLAFDMDSDLQSAIEVWAYAQSRPETNRVIVALGKRDVAFDTDLPILERVYRDGQLIEIDTQLTKTTDVMDQHMFLQVKESCPIEVGDTLVFSTSHPCITFDKWRYIAVCEDGIATHWMKTDF